MNNKDILVTVVTTSFNHEPYIRDCLEGIVNQKTTFAYEAIVHDDASTDNSAGIIREYAVKYPDIIKPVFQKENQYSKGVLIGKNYIYPIAKGKYIAYCEGDDYWTDPYKLQKQVDYLEAHPECGMVHSNIRTFFDDSNTFADVEDSEINNAYSEYTISERILMSKYVVRTATVVLRKDAYDMISSSDDFLFKSGYLLMGDTPLWFELSRLFKIFFFDDVMSVYRIRMGSASKQIDVKKRLRFNLSMFELRKYLSEKYSLSTNLTNSIEQNYSIALADYMLYDNEFVPIFEPAVKVKYMWPFLRKMRLYFECVCKFYLKIIYKRIRK